MRLYIHSGHDEFGSVALYYYYHHHNHRLNEMLKIKNAFIMHIIPLVHQVAVVFTLGSADTAGFDIQRCTAELTTECNTRFRCFSID